MGQTEDSGRLAKLAEAVSIGEVRMYHEDGGVVIEYRDRGTRKLISDGPTLKDAIDGMDLEI